MSFGWIGSDKPQMRMYALSLGFCVAMRCWSVTGFAYATATTPARDGCQSEHVTVRVESKFMNLNDWYACKREKKNRERERRSRGGSLWVEGQQAAGGVVRLKVEVCVCVCVCVCARARVCVCHG